MLKKEFKSKDVNRARNLIMGKTNASTGIQIGYNKKIKEYKEGDIWIEGKKTWTIKNGIKKTVSKLNSIRKEIITPLFCPKCNRSMNHHLHKNSFRIHNHCHDCLVKFEHKLRYKGKYKNYLKAQKVKNKLTILEETESFLLDLVNSSNDGFVSEDGIIEKWVGGIDKKEFIKNIKKLAQERKKEIKKEINE